MRKFLVFLALTAALAFVPGCAKSDGKSDSGTVENGTQSGKSEGDGSEEDIMAKELSEDEIEVLCRMFIDEGRIRAGRLTAYMKYTLAQFRYLKVYLAEKYPEATFEFIGGNKQTIGVSFATFKFRDGSKKAESALEGEEEDRVYWADVYGNSDDKPATMIKDNYYSVAAEEKYEDYLGELLGNDFDNIISLYVEISTPHGYEADLETPIEKYLNVLITTVPWIQICFSKDAAANEAELEELAKEVEVFVRERNIRGLYVIATVEDKEAGYTYTKSDYIYSYYFNL